MGIQLKRIGHVGILVSDFERSFKFYTEILGCKVTSRRRSPDGAANLIALVRLSGEGPSRVTLDADVRDVLLSTEDADTPGPAEAGHYEFMERPNPIRLDATTRTIDFTRPGAVVLSLT